MMDTNVKSSIFELLIHWKQGRLGTWVRYDKYETGIIKNMKISLGYSEN